MFPPGNKTQGHLRWASPWFSRFGTREPGTPPAKPFRSNPRGPLQSVRSTLGFLFLLSACPGKMRPSRHSVLPAATLPRCHAAPLLCCCAGPMPCYCAFPLPRCRSAVLPRCCAAVLPRYRAAVLSACAGCRTQPIVRVYTFGGRGTVEQEEMQTWERDTGGRSPGHADNRAFWAQRLGREKPSRI